MHGSPTIAAVSPGARSCTRNAATPQPGRTRYRLRWQMALFERQAGQSYLPRAGYTDHHRKECPYGLEDHCLDLHWLLGLRAAVPKCCHRRERWRLRNRSEEMYGVRRTVR
ncbi:hypothetical protein BN2475_440056 [Paraburkholderia ribeironis]|uniref:Uncharacterized protein n=1 Tax=Paraburkholderia ribeironis TaxID=1247936 RepID=A0A1N7S8H2_9BURK|nr:hypothetical protein BN2475_440056 [Paraburkholderia ribeironis]